MPTYRYQGMQQNRTPVFGTAEAENESVLRAALTARGVHLLQFHVLSVDATLGAKAASLPRLYQLRVGERLREAILTGLPAHDAIRAMAAEPFQHPVLALMPWLLVLGLVALLPAVGWTLLVPQSSLPLQVVALLVVVLLPPLWLACWYFMDHRPRQLLLGLARRMESGADPRTAGMWGLPQEVRAVLQAKINDQHKALAVADLVPALMGVRFHHHRFLLSIVGSAAFAMLLGLGMYVLLWQIVPQFNSIFSDFGLELPFMTKLLVQSADMFSKGGLLGFLTLLLSAVGLLVFLYFALTTGRVAEALSHVPLFGLPIRWLMQARVARVLSSMLRYDADRAEALLAATAASSFQSVRRSGQFLAAGLRSGNGITGLATELSGLPLSLLAVQPQQSEWPSQSNTNEATNSGGDSVRPGPQLQTWSPASIAENFATLARLLEQASQGQGRFLAVLMQYAITVFAGLMVGFVVIALFLPLIRLINDLS